MANITALQETITELTATVESLQETIDGHTSTISSMDTNLTNWYVCLIPIHLHCCLSCARRPPPSVGFRKPGRNTIVLHIFSLSRAAIDAEVPPLY